MKYDELHSIVRKELNSSTKIVPDEVLRLLAHYLLSIFQLFQSDLVGVYVRGSLACGGFDPRSSDVDVFVILEERMDARRFDKLRTVHEDLREQFPCFGPRLEVAYLSRADIRTYRPNTCHPTIVKRAPLQSKLHESDWILERVATVDHGIALLGPPAGTLIDRVSSGEIRKTAEEILDRWIVWARDEESPDWKLPAIHKAFVVQSTCRALFTAIYGEMVSKEAAVDWALSWLEEPWSTTVRNSKNWRLQNGKQIHLRPEIRGFLGWVEENKREIRHKRQNNA